MVSLKIKERRAIKIFENILKESGFELKKLSCEDALPTIIAKGKKVEYKDYKLDVEKHSNDFLIIGENPIFAEIRFVDKKIKRTDFKNGGNVGEVVLVFITKEEIYITRLNSFVENGALQLLEDNDIIKIKADIVDKYKAELKKL